MPEIRLLLAPDLSERLQRSLIHEDDIRYVIAGCEATGVKLLDNKTGAFIGHQRRGALTYWVRYKPEGGAYRVEAVYTHRAALEEEDGPNDERRLAVTSEAANPGTVICLNCGKPLIKQKVRFFYLRFPFWDMLPACPGCGQVHLSEDYVSAKLAEVEQMLEDK